MVKEVVPMEQRETCATEGCEKKVQLQGRTSTGKATFRKVCSGCHQKAIAEKHGVSSMAQVIAKNAGFKTVSEYNHHIAKEKGFSSYTAYKNSTHRYLKNRKTYCENKHGMAKWIDPDTGKTRYLREYKNSTCNYEIVHMAQLSVDHINGNHYDDRVENHQTLCHNCHKLKSILSKDHWSTEKKEKHIKEMKELHAKTSKKIVYVKETNETES